MNSDKISCKTNGQIAGHGERKTARKLTNKNKAQECESKWKWNQLEHCFGMIPDENFSKTGQETPQKGNRWNLFAAASNPHPWNRSTILGGKFEDFIKIFCKWLLSESFSPYFLVGAELENLLKGAKIKEILQLKDGCFSALAAQHSAAFPSFPFSSKEQTPLCPFDLKPPFPASLLSSLPSLGFNSLKNSRCYQTSFSPSSRSLPSISHFSLFPPPQSCVLFRLKTSSLPSLNQPSSSPFVSFFFVPKKPSRRSSPVFSPTSP